MLLTNDTFVSCYSDLKQLRHGGGGGGVTKDEELHF